MEGSLSADEARDAVLKSGVTAVPGVKTLQQAAFGKVFSGRKPDGSIWKITKVNEDEYTAEC